MYTSDRGYPLSLNPTQTLPAICVELADKWYDLFLVKADGTVTDIDLLDLELDNVFPRHMTVCGSHCFNPDILDTLADYYNASVNIITRDLIIGRWSREHLNVFTVK